MTCVSQTQFPEARAMRTQQENLLNKSLEMRGLLDALCKVLIDAGVISEQRLLATDDLLQRFADPTLVTGACLDGAYSGTGTLHTTLPPVS